jgi:hypothetical protein
MSELFRRTAWAVAICSSLFLAGCGDDDNDTNTPSPITTPTPSPTPTATPTPSPSATPTPSTGQDVSFVGVARQIDEGAGTLHVGGRSVNTDSATVIKDMNGQSLTLGQIQNGQTVRVKGREASDGSVLAEVITVQ